MEPGTQPETQPVTQPESQPELQPEQDVVTAMVQYYLNMKRGPYKSNDALKKAKTADPSSTARIFVDENEIALDRLLVNFAEVRFCNGDKTVTEFKNQCCIGIVSAWMLWRVMR